MYDYTMKIRWHTRSEKTVKPMIKSFHYLLTHFLFKFLKRLVKYLEIIQGKGYGAVSLDREIREASSLINMELSSAIIIFDIGANVGLYSAKALKFWPNATIYAFEPSATSFSVLNERFKGDSRVITFNYALSDRAGVTNLYADYPGSGLGSMTKR